ncbi:MAG: TonB-dependent receptor [Gemmatimonadaceae bacterium]|nr:TonB-dependent receptor [Gemmatimonadaceae bacterium]
MKRSLLLFAFLTAAPPLSAQDSLPSTRHERVAGYVRSVASGEVLRGAVIRVDADAQVRQTNEEGFYALVLPAGTHRLRVRVIGYAPLDTNIVVNARLDLTLRLRALETVLQAVQVQAKREERADLDPAAPQMSVVRIDMTAAKAVPPVLGEVDPLRTLTLLPGVATTSDASNAFSVRGGSTDQNLILLDESTIYNPSHILGFLSTFNADAIDNVTLYKGGIPARFGGRLSSVVDIRQRDGNREEFAGTASIGLLSSKLLVEGPVPGKRGSYMLAARRSYADAFIPLASDTTIRDNRAYFYDLNAKAQVNIGSTGAVIASGFMGRDLFALPSAGFGAGWGNRATALRWNQAVGGRLFSKISGTWSDYDYKLGFRAEPDDSASWVAGIVSAELRIDETWQMTANQRLSVGGEFSRNLFRPGRLSPVGDTAGSSLRTREVERRIGITRAAFMNWEMDVGTRLGLQAGLRYADFARVGEGTLYRYANEAPVVWNAALDRYEPGVLVDSSRVSRGTRMAYFDGFEPRATARFSLTPRHSLKASYARTQQFLQLASNTNSPTPLDVWEPAGPFIRPQVADQYAFGWTGQYRGVEFTAETYFRRAENVVDYISGVDVFLNPRLETMLVQGEGRAYGLELFARRAEGRFTGWASYTLARAEQRFPAAGTTNGGISGGRWYVSPFDKTHNLSLVGSWLWTPKWRVGSTFMLASGLPATLPRARYWVDGFLVAEYGDRNSSRLPLYHRLDLSLTRQFRRSELQFGLVNAYNRFNAQSLRVEQRNDNPLVADAVQTSIFGIIPSLNYAFRF